MVTSHIFKSMDFTKTKIYIPREQNFFFSNNKKNNHGSLYGKKYFVAEVTVSLEGLND